jgi:hypothetical protein
MTQHESAYLLFGAAGMLLIDAAVCWAWSKWKARRQRAAYDRLAEQSKNPPAPNREAVDRFKRIARLMKESHAPATDPAREG